MDASTRLLIFPRHVPQTTPSPRFLLCEYTIAWRSAACQGSVCSYAQTELVSPFGRDVAQRQRGLLAPFLRELDCRFAARLRELSVNLYQIHSHTYLPAYIRPLSHLLRKCQLSQRESREICANLVTKTAPARTPQHRQRQRLAAGCRRTKPAQCLR